MSESPYQSSQPITVKPLISSALEALSTAAPGHLPSGPYRSCRLARLLVIHQGPLDHPEHLPLQARNFLVIDLRRMQERKRLPATTVLLRRPRRSRRVGL